MFGSVRAVLRRPESTRSGCSVLQRARDRAPAGGDDERAIERAEIDVEVRWCTVIGGVTARRGDAPLCDLRAGETRYNHLNRPAFQRVSHFQAAQRVRARAS